MSGPGTVYSDEGTARGHAWVDVVGPDPADPADPDGIGPPDGIPDLVQTNSNSPALPFGAGSSPFVVSPGQWTVPPIGTEHAPSLVLRGTAKGKLVDVGAQMTPTQPNGFSLEYPGGSPWGVVAGDYDGDGSVDLFYPCGGFNTDSPNALMRAEGDGTFTNRTAEAGLVEVQISYTAAWLDHDRDGDLDLYVGNGHPDLSKVYVGAPAPDVTDRLYRNNGDAAFTEVGAAAGLDLASTSFSCATTDLDRDGLPDLVVSCFKQFNKVFYNNGDGSFSFMVPQHHPSLQFSLEADLLPDPSFPGAVDFDAHFLAPGTEKVLPLLGVWSMSLEPQDFNGDGWIDLCFGAYTWQLEDSQPFTAEGAVFVPTDRTHLYLNLGDQDGDGRGDGLFREAAVDVGLAHVGGLMGSVAADLNGDGFLDLYAGGGGPKIPWNYEEDYVYVNNGPSWPDDFLQDPTQALPQVFYEVGALSGTYKNLFMAHGLSAIRSLSGRLDLLVGNGGPAADDEGQANVYFAHAANADGSQPQYVAVALQPDRSAPGAPGARVEIVRDHGGGPGQVLVREVRAGVGFTSHNAGPLLFSPGGDALVFASVQWPSGIRQGELLLTSPGPPGDLSLAEPAVSIRLDVRETAPGTPRFDLELESFAAAPVTGNLFAALALPVPGGGWTTGFLSPLATQLQLVPGASLALDLELPGAPDGLYLVYLVNPATGATFTAGRWYEASAPPAPSGDGAPAASPDSAPLGRRLYSIRDELTFAARAVEVSPARVPLEPVRFDLGGEDRLLLASGDELSWRDGRVSFRTGGGGHGTLEMQSGGRALVISGTSLACCEFEQDGGAVLLFFEGVQPPGYQLDGRPVAAPR